MRPLDPAFDMGSRLAAESPGARLDFAMLAHDIRGALQGVLGGVAAIRLDDLPDAAREEIKRIAVAASLIEELSCDLAAFGREAGARSDDAAGEIVLEDFLTSYRNRWSSEARSRGMGLEVVASPGLPWGLRVSRLPLARVLGNLTVNALTHAGRGSVKLEAGVRADGGVAFRLTDEGPGLGEEALRKVSPLGSDAVGPNEAGHGLGLHIVRTLTSQLGGRISVRNRDAGGVEAVLDFPAALNVAAPASLAPAPASAGSAPRSDGVLAGVRVLLAEDNPTNQMVATQMLGILGAEVTLASDGVEALERFEEAAFDIVVVDIEMPRMTGLDVIRAIRGRPDARARTPIVALTAYALREHRERIAEAGADGLISKPITSIDALAKGLAAHVAGQPRRAAPAPHPAPPAGGGGPVVDRAIYEALAAAIGADMMSELLEKVEADLASAAAELTAAREPIDFGPIRSASHILISVAGAVGATRLQRCARELNTAAIAGNADATASLLPGCVAEIDAAIGFTQSERARS
jgi:CheY-like chemotaxis protein/HPt (histidine-containing phosphotransfer) domain-containing protein